MEFTEGRSCDPSRSPKLGPSILVSIQQVVSLDIYFFKLKGGCPSISWAVIITIANILHSLYLSLLPHSLHAITGRTSKIGGRPIAFPSLYHRPPEQNRRMIRNVSFSAPFLFIYPLSQIKSFVLFSPHFTSLYFFIFAQGNPKN